MVPHAIYRLKVLPPHACPVRRIAAERRPRHALDFRLLADNTVAIMDAASPPTRRGGPPSALDPGVLLPIPGIQEVVTQVLQELAAGRAGRAASLGVGIVCQTAGAGRVGRALHDKILERVRR
jgi:mediator of RNA polymerase II transcription subunit 14